MIAPARVATDWWRVTGDEQSGPVLGRMLHLDGVARTMLWILEQPDHVQIGDVVADERGQPLAALAVTEMSGP